MLIYIPFIYMLHTISPQVLVKHCTTSKQTKEREVGRSITYSQLKAGRVFKYHIIVTLLHISWIKQSLHCLSQCFSLISKG